MVLAWLLLVNKCFVVSTHILSHTWKEKITKGKEKRGKGERETKSTTGKGEKKKRKEGKENERGARKK